ncbi:hypothetical protein Tco_0065491 [Tanacetum coccineum]
MVRVLVKLKVDLSYRGCEPDTDTEKGSSRRCRDSQGGWKLRSLAPRFEALMCFLVAVDVQGREVGRYTYPNVDEGWFEGIGAIDGLDGTEHGYQGRCLGEVLGFCNGRACIEVGPLVDEIAEPIVEAEEQVISLVVDMDEDIAMLFGDDDSKGFDEEEVWEVNEEWLMAPATPPLMPAVPPPSVYEVGGPSTAAAEGQSIPLPASGLPVSDAEVADGITIGEIGPRISAVEGQVQVMASQIVYVADRLKQVGTQVEQAVQQRDTQIQQLQTMVSEMSSRESTLMQCILGMDRRLVDLERRPPGPQ